jgi:2-haloacid dehalogenase
VVESAIQRACHAHGVEYRASDAQALYAAVPTWQPHPHVVETLEKIAPHIPLVILSNSMVDLIPHSVAHLKAPFHAVYTAEEAQAYKPRGQAFEYMFDQLGCGPEEMVHCSSSFRYDLMTAKDLGFMGKAYIDRNHEPYRWLWREPADRLPPAGRAGGPLMDAGPFTRCETHDA